MKIIKYSFFITNMTFLLICNQMKSINEIKEVLKDVYAVVKYNQILPVPFYEPNVVKIIG